VTRANNPIVNESSLKQECPLLEPVRLVVWDLDETFWKGTLTEGGVELILDNCNLIRDLARRGIVSSICSRNNHDDVARILTEGEIWDYFVMPSVNWEAKGPRLGAIIESFQLRPASVLFIDDNHLNRQEARHALPDLQVSSPGIIPQINNHEQFRGKDDPEMTRLSQYKRLAQRKFDEQEAKGRTLEFLRSCKIVVSIEHDIVPNIDRAIELINRTNQLNFLKSRLPEDINQAREELKVLLAEYNIQAGLMRVSDRYGDHGYCGLYVLKGTWRLMHFAFSCRILGMGVERWLYQRLGRPPLDVKGEVLVNVISDTSPVDWIQLEERVEPRRRSAATSSANIVARGGCNVQAIYHYFNLEALGSSGEFNFNRNGCDVRVDHSMFLRYAVTGLPAGAMPVCEHLNYRQEDFRSAIQKHYAGRSLWLLSFWADAVFALYRHYDTGVTVPFMVPHWHDQAKDITAVPADDLSEDQRHGAISAPLDYLRCNFEYLGIISEGEFKQNLKLIVNSAPRDTRIVILGANEDLWDPKANIRHHSSAHAALNRWTRAIARWRRNITILKVRDFIESDAEVHNWDHFDRMVYFRIYKEVERLLRRN
jgi:FkbH-like protein